MRLRFEIDINRCKNITSWSESRYDDVWGNMARYIGFRFRSLFCQLVIG